MNGALALLRTAAAAGVRVCFANPGTTEMALVKALDDVPELRAVLGLFEGVCTGAADGYGRMTGSPALTLLHLGPGFANGIANLHNARRARSPVVNLIGDHASWHLSADAPLTSDIDSLARAVSHRIRRTGSGVGAARETAAAVAAARSYPHQIATLILPTDTQEDEVVDLPQIPEVPEADRVSEDRIHRTAELLAEGVPVGLLLGGNALSPTGLAAAGAIAAKTGVRLISETFVGRAERGRGFPQVTRLPYFPEPALELLGTLREVVLVGAKSPVAFFGYEGVPSSLVPEDCLATILASPAEDAEAALVALAAELDASAGSAPPREGSSALEAPSGELTPDSLARALITAQPEGAIVVDESATSGGPYTAMAHAAPAHSVLQLTGGAIGQGMPCATGAAVACPDRPVISLQADGSGMYTVQALWTQAREGLDVTTILCSNRSYRILRVELARAGVKQPGEKAEALTDLGSPDIDWTEISRGMGVPACRVERAEDLHREILRALEEPGPHLIEALL